MPTLYVFNPELLSHYSSLELALSAHFTMVPIHAIEALEAKKDEKGIVLLPYIPQKTLTWMGVCKTLAPCITPLVTLSHEDLEKVDMEVSQQADLLVMPTQPVEILARLQAAMALSDLRALIQETVHLDEDTGLYSQTYFMKRLGEEISLAKRHQSPMTCVILSIAYYDVFLDSYGFDFVTQVVQHISEIIKEQVRGEDIVARVGGSEIAMLLPRSTEKGAMALTRRILQKVEQAPITIQHQTEDLSLKCGIVGFPLPDEPDMGADTMVRYARHALHHARCSEDVSIQLFAEMKPMVG